MHADLVYPYYVSDQFMHLEFRKGEDGSREQIREIELLIDYFLCISQGLPKSHRTVKYVGLYTLLGYFAVIICYLAAWCHPITAYWAVPVSECEALTRSRYRLAQYNFTEA